jgi:AcrR family transcriptional regulator
MVNIRSASVRGTTSGKGGERMRPRATRAKTAVRPPQRKPRRPAAPATRRRPAAVHGPRKAVPSGSACPLSTRERILLAAAHIYALHGYEGASIQAIADRAGVTKPLIFYHFASKERLFSSLLREAVDECNRVSSAVESLAQPAADRLRLLLARHVELARQAPAFYAFAYDAFTKPQVLPLDFDYRAKGEEIFHRMARLVAEGQERSELQGDMDPTVVAAAVLATLHMHVQAVLSRATEEIPPGLDERMFNLLMHGLEVRGR